MGNSLSRGLSRLVLFGAGLSLMACPSGLPKPIDIAPEDLCQRCKMVISQKRLAAEFLDPEGLAYKFDDLSCMIHFLKTSPESGPAIATYVVDFESGAWIRADEAYFLRSGQLKTPMGGGAAAFKDLSKAEAAAVKYQGSITRFGELEKEY